jgi:apolipoprotein N-acyltransferase
LSWSFGGGVAAARLAWWGLKAAGTPFPFPAAIGVIAGLAVYMLLYRLVVRWAARPELRHELARRGGPSGTG